MSPIVLTQNQRGIVTLIGGFFLMLASGTVFMWGSLNIYVTSYFRSKVDIDLKVSAGGAIFPVMMMSLAFGIPIGMKMVKYFRSATIACIISSIIAAGSMFASSYMERFWQFVIVFGVVQGFAQGTIYFVPIYVGYLYYPKKRGLVAGITTGGFAICSFVFGLIFYKIVNPNGLAQVKNPSDGFFYFQDSSLEVALNVPSTLRIISGITLIISILSSFLILLHPDQTSNTLKSEQIKATFSTQLQLFTVTDEQQQQQLQSLPQSADLEKQEEYSSTPSKRPEESMPQVAAVESEAAAARELTVLHKKMSSNQEERDKYYEEIAFTENEIENKEQIKELQSNTIEERKPSSQPPPPPHPSSLEIDELDKRGAPSASHALKQPQFYMSIFLGIISSGIGVLVNGNYKTISKDAGFTDDSFQTLLGSLGGLANGLSRPLWATLLDKFTFKQIIIVILAIEVVFSCTMRFAAKDQILLGIWVFVTHMTFGAVLGMWPVFSAQINGVRIGSELFGMYWCGFSIANFLQFIIVLLLRDNISFDNIYFIYTAQALLSIAIVLSYNFKVSWSKYYLSDMKKLVTPTLKEMKSK